MAKKIKVPDDRLSRFKQYLTRRGLKSTGQRDAIVRVFFAADKHVSADELYRLVRGRNPSIGFATVYRTMRLLVDCGLANESHFRDGEARYESADQTHHDHLICESCGRIVEFAEERIERLQNRIAADLGFRITGHKMELHGICPTCQAAETVK